jgi:hypothetical protein
MLRTGRDSGEDDQLRRIGSNIRKKHSEERANRLPKSIILYTDGEVPKNDYPRRIVSPPRPADCCTDANRISVGSVREVEGFKFCYKICQECGHAVRYFYPAVKTNDDAVRKYRDWKKYMTQ